MKIIHCCLAAVYTEGFGYQENIIPRMHKAQGHDVMILASIEVIEPGVGYVYTTPAIYQNEDEIPVVRIPYKGFMPTKLASKVRWYNGVEKVLLEFEPDIIFMHDAQTAAVFPIIKYLKNHSSCRLYVDSHTDFINSAKGWLSKSLLHGVLYKWYVRNTIPYARKYYGTLPARVTFYRNVYGTPAEKTEYLPLGVDDLKTPMSLRETVKQSIRDSLGISQDSFVIVSGGKLESRKNTIMLMQAFCVLSQKYPNVHLILFGSISPEILSDFDNIIHSNSSISYIGWVSSNETYKYFFAADLACFPGTHSTLWEEAVGYGIPAIFKYWDGIDQVDLGGNCIMLREPITVLSISSSIEKVLIDKVAYQHMKEVSLVQGVEQFSYSRIARYAIQQ